MTSEVDLRDQVRERYAAAAVAVTETRREALPVVDGCCGPADNASCCGATGEVDAAFGSGLYSADEQSELPAEAVLASLGCGNPLAVADCTPASECSIWVPAAGSTCCSPRAGSVKPASPTAWT